MTDTQAVNTYGDHRLLTDGAFGIDIAIQRADELDLLAIDRIRSLAGRRRALDVASASGGQAIRMAVAGADVIALDISDYSAPFMHLAAPRASMLAAVSRRRTYGGLTWPANSACLM